MDSERQGERQGRDTGGPAPEQTAPAKPAATGGKAGSAGSNPVRTWSLAAVLVCVLLFLGHALVDKHIPYTANVRVQGYVVPIIAQVSGPLTAIRVENNQPVKAGEVLAVIDPAKYELAVRQAEANLQQAIQASSADVAAISTAQARVEEAQANLRNARIKGERIIRLAKKGAASRSRADDARALIAASEARLKQAQANLEQVRARFGAPGPDNAGIKAARAALDSARLDLERSVLRAPSDGIITNLIVDVGQYVATGSPVMTFISTSFLWLQADMRENCLVNIRAGNPVEIVLDAAPGRLFAGRVMSIGFGVSDKTGNRPGALSPVRPAKGWLRQAQYMPVLIRFEDLAPVRPFLRLGGQGNVLIHTGDNPLYNVPGHWWMRLTSLLTYLY